MRACDQQSSRRLTALTSHFKANKRIVDSVCLREDEMFKTVKIRSYEMGLYFRDGEFQGLLGTGRHWFTDPLGKVRVEAVSQRAPWLACEKLDVIVRSGALKDRAVVLDLKDDQRGLVWVDGRFSHVRQGPLDFKVLTIRPDPVGSGPQPWREPPDTLVSSLSPSRGHR
jgi:hypothetical protein